MVTMVTMFFPIFACENPTIQVGSRRGIIFGRTVQNIVTIVTVTALVSITSRSAAWDASAGRRPLVGPSVSQGNDSATHGCTTHHGCATMSCTPMMCIPTPCRSGMLRAGQTVGVSTIGLFGTASKHGRTAIRRGKALPQFQNNALKPKVKRSPESGANGRR